MKALIKKAPEKGLVIGNVEEPVLRPGHVKIEISKTAICGTDVHIYNWDAWSAGRLRPPVVVGHEFMGHIVEVAEDVKGLEVGQRVSAEGHVTCGHCRYCRTGNGHVCQDVEIIGVDIDGCFTRYIVMPAGNVWPVPEQVKDSHAAIYDPVGNAMHTVTAQAVAGKTVLITGAGAIGLFAVPIAKSLGAVHVLVVEPNETKRQWARQVGADWAFHPEDPDLKPKVLEHSQGYGADVLLEMSGNPKAIAQGLDLLANMGEAAMLGIPSGDIALDITDTVIFKALTVRGVNGRRMFDTWYSVDRFYLHHGSMIDPILTHELPVTEYEKAFDLLREGKAGKIILDMEAFHE